jgi:hypothetical protein
MRSSGRDSTALRIRLTASTTRMNVQIRRDRGTIGGFWAFLSGRPSTRQGCGVFGSDLRSGVRG